MTYLSTINLLSYLYITFFIFIASFPKMSTSQQLSIQQGSRLPGCHSCDPVGRPGQPRGVCAPRGAHGEARTRRQAGWGIDEWRCLLVFNGVSKFCFVINENE